MTDIVSKFIDPLATDRSPQDKSPPAAGQTEFEQVLNTFFTQKTSSQVQETLRQMQIPEPKNYNEYLRGTDGLIIFDNARGVVIRIEKESGYMDSSRANDSRWMIQPLASVKTATGSATVEIVPGVHFEKSDAESRKLYWKLASDGYDFWDERLDNVGRLPLKNVQFPEGVPVVIDRMAARPLESVHLLNRALPLTVFPWLLEGHRSPVHKNDLHFWDIIAEQKQMISEGARKATGYVMPSALVPPPDPQEVLYGDLKKSFREAWPEDATAADPQKMKAFWEQTARAKTEGRLVAGWNEEAYDGRMSKPKEAPNHAEAYEKRLNAAGIYDVEKSSLRVEVLSTIARYRMMGEKKMISRGGQEVSFFELRTKMPGTNDYLPLRLPDPDFARPAPDFEKRNRLTGISGQYTFPDHLQPTEIQAYAMALNHAAMRGDITSATRLEKMENLHAALVRHTPDLARLKVPEGNRTQALYDIALGSASGYNIKDIQFYISGNNGVVAGKDPTYKTLLDQVHAHDRPEWVPAPETLENINRQMEQRHAPAAHSRVSPKESLQSKAGKTTGRADIALSLAEGNYGMAGVAAGQQLVLNEKAMAGAAKLAVDIAPVAKGIGFFAKKVPVIGAAVTAGYVLYEVGDNLVDGQYGRAGAALVAGTAETIGNLVGFGVGDGAREAARSGIITAAGEEYAPMKSGLRTLGERGADYLGKFIGDDTPERIAQRQEDLIKSDPVLPKTVKLSGRTVPLTEALREETFRKNFRETLAKANGKDGLALETQIKNIETFEKLEATRRQLAEKKPSASEKRLPAPQIADQQIP